MHGNGMQRSQSISVPAQKKVYLLEKSSYNAEEPLAGQLGIHKMVPLYIEQLYENYIR